MGGKRARMWDSHMGGLMLCGRGRHAVESSGAAVECHGPMPQAHFLAGLGAMARLEALLALADEQQAAALISSARRLMGGRPSTGGGAKVPGEGEPEVDAEGMGYSYQAMAISPAGLPPVPFSPQPDKRSAAKVPGSP